MPTDPAILFNEATQLAKAGQKTEALTRLRRLLLQEPTHIAGLMYLAWLTPDVYEGIAAWEKVLHLNKLADGPKSYLAQPVLPEKTIKGIRSADLIAKYS